MNGTPGRKFYVWAAFPPPVTGKTAITAAVAACIVEKGVHPRLFNVSSIGLSRSLWARLCRIPHILNALARFLITLNARGNTVYVSVSGGWGQLYETAFVLAARLRGCKIVAHHHSFAYLDRYSWRTKLLTMACGRRCIHITQSAGMAARLRSQYSVVDARGISNAAFLMTETGEVEGHRDGEVVRERVRAVGFISNICLEKGIMEFLDLMALSGNVGLSLYAKVAGPFQDAAIEQAVRERLRSLPQVEYVGPQYGAAKDAFYAGIDVLVFPTRYENETEGIVNHEAMSRGIPVIAYGRGCIPEIVGADCGLVVDPAEPFAPAALAKLESWLADPAAFQAASQAAAVRFARTYDENAARWRALLEDIVGAHPGDELRQRERS